MVWCVVVRFCFLVNLKKWAYPTHYLSLALLTNSTSLILKVLDFCKLLLDMGCMLEQVTTVEETKDFSCSAWIQRMPLT